MTIRVTTEDTETGEKEVAEITDDYILVVAGTHRLHHVAQYPTTGTVVLTIKSGPTR